MDNRASIKIKFSIYGKTYETDLSINYIPDNGYPDERVTEFFDKAYSNAKAHYDLKRTPPPETNTKED